MRYCIHCGKEIKETADFCPYCGKKQANKTRQEDSEHEIQFDTNALKEMAREKMSQAKELGKDISQQGKEAVRKGIDVLKEERASDVRNEYRILDNKKLCRYIKIMAILGLLCGAFCFEVLVLFFLLISMHRVKKVYLSDQTSLFIINVLAVLLSSCIGIISIWIIYGEKFSAALVIEAFISFCAIALSVAVVVIFCKIIKRQNRKKLLMFVFICMAVCKIFVLVGASLCLFAESHEQYKEEQESQFVHDFKNYYYSQYEEEFYVDNEGEDSSISRDELEKFIKENKDIYGEDFREFEKNYRPQEDDSFFNSLFKSVSMMVLSLIWILLQQLLYHGALFLFILAIDNAPDKAYASKSEPDGRHIKTRSIGLSIILSILTLGIYYTFIWRYSIMSDIRKVRKMGSIALGEWLLYTFVPFYSFYWLYTRGSALTVVSENNRLRSTGSGGLFIFFQIIFWGFINTMLIQNTLNALAKVMDKDFIYGDMIQADYSASSGVADSQDENIKKIKELYELKEKGIISEEEYEDRKKHFLAQM